MAAQAPPPLDAASVSFEADRSGFRRKQKWTIVLKPDSAEFTDSEGKDSVTVARDEALAQFQFAKAWVAGHNLVVTKGAKTFTFKVEEKDLSRLRSWLPTKGSVASMKQELRKWGIGLIILGIAHLVLSGFLDPVWGVIIIVIGVLNLVINRRGMFIVNGIALLLVGVMNILAGAMGGWTVFGLFQIIWGIQEIRKFSRYGPAEATPPPIPGT